MSVTPLLSQGLLLFVLFVWVVLSVGSFLNVAIYRLPVMLKREWRTQATEVLELDTPAELGPTFNLMTPRSRCPTCAITIPARHNIPVISWILLRGRCANCHAPISPRYPLVELLTAIASIAVIAVYGYTWLGAAALVFTWSIITLTFIDFDTQLLPDQITLPLLWLGLTVNLLGGFTDLNSAVVGAMVGYLVLWSIYWAFKLITGKEGMGYGDFKLLAAMGAWFGWQTLPMLVLISSIVGILLGGTFLLVRRSREAIPFGPYLAIAGWVTLLERDRVIAFVFG
ncbi:MAG: A24 family peptidase [Proteobacteria bacterium]|nr:A24 family peptidase [Pseudomonadota bacterium]